MSQPNARRFALHFAAALLLAGTAACGGGSETKTEERTSNRTGMAGLTGGGATQNRSDPAPDEGNSQRGAPVATGEGKPDAPRPAEAPAPSQNDSRSTSRDGLDRRVRVVNNSDQTITLIYGSSVGERAWGRDRIPTTTLAAGSATVVDFNDDNGECQYDLRADFADRSSREQRNVNICRVSEWAITGSDASTVR